MSESKRSREILVVKKDAEAEKRCSSGGRSRRSTGKKTRNTNEEQRREAGECRLSWEPEKSTSQRDAGPEERTKWRAGRRRSRTGKSTPRARGEEKTKRHPEKASRRDKTPLKGRNADRLFFHGPGRGRGPGKRQEIVVLFTIDVFLGHEVV